MQVVTASLEAVALISVLLSQHSELVLSAALSVLCVLAVNEFSSAADSTEIVIGLTVGGIAFTGLLVIVIGRLRGGSGTVAAKNSPK